MRNHRRRHEVALLLGLAWVQTLCAEMVVIVHPSNPVQTMTAREVSDLYLGRSRAFPSGDGGALMAATLYEPPSDSVQRESFFRALNGMSLHQLNAYWARLRFSGEVLPPLVLADNRTLLNAVGRERSAIAYVDAAAVGDASVKIVLRLKD